MAYGLSGLISSPCERLKLPSKKQPVLVLISSYLQKHTVCFCSDSY